MTWFPRWRARVVDLLRRYDWPDLESEWWSELHRLVAETQCTEDVATAAISILYRNHPAYLDQIPGAMVSVIESLDNGKKRTREEAERVSRGCPECGGDGCTVRYVRSRRGIVPTACICHRCAAGQWLRDWRDPKTGDQSPIPDLIAWPPYQDERLKLEWNPAYVRHPESSAAF